MRHTPTPTNRLLRIREVIAATGLRRSTLYSLIGEGRFPRPVRISERTTAWLESEVNDWVTERVAERDAGQSGAA